jgi:site-specific DNA-cytosine methylase
MVPPLRSLDLFSGVGALTLSLKGVAEPVAYCEISSPAVAVLTHQMRCRRRLCAATCGSWILPGLRRTFVAELTL